MYMSNSYSRRLALCSNVDMVQVVAAVLQSGDKILVGQRMPQQSHPLKWEFPGGKVEPGESPEQALARELEEELGISGASGEGMTRYLFTYPGKDPIQLIFFRVPHFSRHPRKPGQPAEPVPPRHGQPPRRAEEFHPVLRFAAGSGLGGSPHQNAAVPGHVLRQPVRILHRRQPPRWAQSGMRTGWRRTWPG